MADYEAEIAKLKAKNKALKERLKKKKEQTLRLKVENYVLKRESQTNKKIANNLSFLINLDMSLKMDILSFLRDRDVLSVRSTCHTFLKVADENNLWRVLYQVRFRETEESIRRLNVPDWKLAYRFPPSDRRQHHNVALKIYPLSLYFDVDSDLVEIPRDKVVRNSIFIVNTSTRHAFAFKIMTTAPKR